MSTLFDFLNDDLSFLMQICIPYDDASDDPLPASWTRVFSCVWRALTGNRERGLFRPGVEDEQRCLES